jgi:hypothetical protein
MCPNVQPDDLRLHLDLCRLACWSFGETTLTYDRWMYVRGLEEARRARLPAPRRSTLVPDSPVSVSAM